MMHSACGALKIGRYVLCLAVAVKLSVTTKATVMFHFFVGQCRLNERCVGCHVDMDAIV
jgi:hypothetical protein